MPPSGAAGATWSVATAVPGRAPTGGPSRTPPRRPGLCRGRPDRHTPCRSRHGSSPTSPAPSVVALPPNFLFGGDSSSEQHYPAHLCFEVVNVQEHAVLDMQRTTMLDDLDQRLKRVLRGFR